MRLNITYTTAYHYDAPIPYGLQRLRQTPWTRPGQALVTWRTDLTGAHKEVSYRDHFDNQVDLVTIAPDAHEITVTSAGEVDTEDLHGVLGRHTGFAPLWLFLRETQLTQRTRAIRDLARHVNEGDDVTRMHELMDLIAERVSYQTGTTNTATTADEALNAGTGVCQDHTHIFCAAARSLGYPARYISGFLMMEGQTHQAASHAWAEVHLDGLGWVGFDASNKISPDERYVCVATGLDYRDAAPVSGIRHGFATESLAVTVIVEQ